MRNLERDLEKLEARLKEAENAGLKEAQNEQVKQKEINKKGEIKISTKQKAI
ncbi:hypothetical protein ACYJA9_001676 [Campylobacter upsaliensis]|uniref:hypothetical protein n=1 Tax=Campylobacter upsaliensis TaxID=28080 RepID=UPI00139EE5AA|nr:hypothetical protein [Campylobacter upsaliensis]EDP6868758.1 hypothetical protein [Campylobacter upsaliensis]EDP6910611.1 hypothetical protein [Campylobacter upsaliensis]EDP6920739.1 hypothetical protein [Campylobacter upsaliensis]EDP6922381.1 hypothetical protein [Campylobacter upsaliensis]EFO6607130.1 hypothetical protein [Campylobacter upsaliensis]